MEQELVQNPIRKLLDSLPADVAKRKWSAIYDDLLRAGMFEHFRQNISKPGRDLGKTNIRAAVILKNHLGLTDDFFLSTPAEQDEEVKRIVKQYYDLTLATHE